METYILSRRKVKMFPIRFQKIHWAGKKEGPSCWARRLRQSGAAFALFGQLALGQKSIAPQVVSFLGDTLYPPRLSAETAAEFEKKLLSAQDEWSKRPDDPDAMIWVGRRLAYLGRYREAIDLYTEGILRFPNDPRFLRHRGHRYLSTRQLDAAIRDLDAGCKMIRKTPDAIEPDGLPNALNIPTSTLQFNLWYHLGLAHYLQGDFALAQEAYQNCLAVSTNPDSQVASRYWLHLTLARLGRSDEALDVLRPVTHDLAVIEDFSYHRLLLFFQGKVTERELREQVEGELDRATVEYGIGAWHLVNGHPERAVEIFTTLIRGEERMAFGAIAAEAELARSRQFPNTSTSHLPSRD